MDFHNEVRNCDFMVPSDSRFYWTKPSCGNRIQALGEYPSWPLWTYNQNHVFSADPNTISVRALVSKSPPKRYGKRRQRRREHNHKSGWVRPALAAQPGQAPQVSVPRRHPHLARKPTTRTPKQGVQL